MKHKKHTVNVILSGGSGTRLWPLSRHGKPKQFLEIFYKQSLFQHTVLRNQSKVDDFLLITNAPSIFNTDQGSQYTSEIHTKALKDNNVKISMDGKGRAIDNIFIERLWRTVKYENLYFQSYSDGITLYNGLEKYFEFYNEEKLHQSLNYKTPSSIYCLRNVA